MAVSLGRAMGLSRYLRAASILAAFLLVNFGAIVLLRWKHQRDFASDLGRAYNYITPAPTRGNLQKATVGEKCTLEGGIQDTINSRHAVVIDAGSTGSRVHVYEFRQCGQRLAVLVDELFSQVKPGLGHYNGEPHRAGQSLLPLLQTAQERIPAWQQQCTPIVLKATAGLRLLPPAAVESILRSAHEALERTPFSTTPAPFKGKAEGRQESKAPREEPTDVASLLDGAEEAVFAWATVNFLMDSVSAGVGGHAASSRLSAGARGRDATTVVMDLGGASTQIVFAVADVPATILADRQRFAQSYYKLSLLGIQQHLYQQSYLGYGLIEAEKRIKAAHVARMLPEAAQAHQHNGGNEKRVRRLKFPCFPTGHEEEIASGDTVVLFGDSSGWEACLGTVEPIFDRRVECSSPPCSFNGIHQPPIKAASIVAFSYFFDSLIPLGLSSPMTLAQVQVLGRRLCRVAVAPPGSSGALHTSALGHFERLAQENGNWCLDVAYIYSLLHVGYGISLDQPIIVTKQINGYEAGWSLGAALKLLEANPTTCPSSLR